MVYLGRPSRGCQLCKKRKIKCDEARPSCSQCQNSKRLCPGYVDQFDLVLRDQTDSVRRKVERAKQKGSHVNKPKVPKFPPAPGNDVSEEVLLQSSAVDLILPRTLAETPEEFAICSFFNQFVLIPFHPDGQRGFLECLLPLYTTARHDSLLSVATTAVALTVSAGSPWRRADFELGRCMFGKALRMAAAAIQDPIASTEDETLMAVLLLGFYERLGSAIVASKATGTHEAGASALIKHRGKQNNKSELSAKLSLAVQTQIVEAAGQMQTSATTAPVDLVDLGANIPRNTASRLTPISAQVANLCRLADRTFQVHLTPEVDDIDVLINDAYRIDAKLQAWADSVPDLWRYHPATGIRCPVDQPRELFVYQDRMDVYEDVNIANVWNAYRTNRLSVYRVILKCVSWLGFPTEDKGHQFLQQVTQELVDAICASVPFHIGTKMVGGPQDRDEVEYPYRGGSYLTRAQRQACAAYGGWYLLSSLQPCLVVDGLRPGQKEWIIDQIKRIGRLYSLKWTSYLFTKGKKELTSFEWERGVRMACPIEEIAARECFDSF